MISFIIPVYNDEIHIIRCIESILKYKQVEDEIIVVDDGSRDNTFDILVKKYSRQDIKILKKCNGGPNSARKYGLLKSIGNYICFVDSDDEIVDFLPTDISIDYDLVFFGIDETKTNRETLLKQLFYIENNNNNINTLWNKLYNRQFLIDNLSNFVTDIYNGEDMLWNCYTILKTDRLKFYSYSFYKYNFNKDSVTNKHNKRLLEDDQKFQCYLNDYFKYSHLPFFKQILNSCKLRGLSLIIKNEFKRYDLSYTYFKEQLKKIESSRVYLLNNNFDKKSISQKDYIIVKLYELKFWRLLYYIGKIFVKKKRGK